MTHMVHPHVTSRRSLQHVVKKPWLIQLAKIGLTSGYQYDFPKTKIAPENWPTQKESRKNHQCSGAMLASESVNPLIWSPHYFTLFLHRFSLA